MGKYLRGVFVLRRSLTTVLRLRAILRKTLAFVTLRAKASSTQHMPVRRQKFHSGKTYCMKILCAMESQTRACPHSTTAGYDRLIEAIRKPK